MTTWGLGKLKGLKGVEEKLREVEGGLERYFDLTQLL
jgi:hypothetical protein